MPGSHPIAQTSRIPRRGPTISRASRVLFRMPWHGPRATPTRHIYFKGTIACGSELGARRAP